MQSQLTSMEKIEDVHVDSLIWTEAEASSIRSSMPSFQIYTVSKSIKNPRILNHIKPDYGSLGDFMKNVGISKDILLHNRKRKNEQQQDLEQKKLRTTLKQKNLDKILKQQNSSQLQKAVASKMIVENLFEGQFGMGLNNFCSQNNRTENNKHNYLSIGDLANTLDDLMVQKKDSQLQFQIRNQLPTLTRQKLMLSNKQIKTLNLTQRIEKVKKLQQHYPSLRKILLTSNSEDSKLLLSQGVLHFQNCTLNINSLHSQLVSVDIDSIKCLRLTNVSITDDLFSLLLDYFTEANIMGIRELIIEKCAFASNGKLAQRLKTFIEETKIKRVQLTSLNLTNRDFCIISLGIGPRNTFEYLGLRGNQISQVAKKCLDVLLKFHKETQFDFTGNPIEKDLKGKVAYSRCFK